MNFILNLKGLEQMEITNTLLLMAIGIPGILVATTIHEFTRALLSTIFGDNYPKSQKRLTLNPIRHFEPIGFLMMFYSGGFGWGKPVETSALYYKNRKTRRKELYYEKAIRTDPCLSVHHFPNRLRHPL